MEREVDGLDLWVANKRGCVQLALWWVLLGSACLALREVGRHMGYSLKIILVLSIVTKCMV